MELQTKYQYTYFIYPYLIENGKYDNYISNLLKNKNCEKICWEKDKNLDIYNFFLPSIRKYMFNNFEKGRINANTVCFNYNLEKDIQGKIGEEDGIFFNIQKIHILCFKCGISFLIFKTNVENTTKFSDILNFNYKFRDINSDYNILREYENIKIQTDTFENMSKLIDFINEITDNASSNNKIDTNRFYTYSYVCLEQESWNSENLIKEFVKFSNFLPSNYNITKQSEEKDIMNNIKYTKLGVNEYGVTMLCSKLENANYTTLPITFENEYLYLYILSLYQKIYLKKIIEDLKNKKEYSEYVNLEKELISNNITNDEIGNKFYKELIQVLKIEETKQEIKDVIDTEYKKLDIEKAKKTNKILFIILICSLLLNIINFIVLMQR